MLRESVNSVSTNLVPPKVVTTLVTWILCFDFGVSVARGSDPSAQYLAGEARILLEEPDGNSEIAALLAAESIRKSPNLEAELSLRAATIRLPPSSIRWQYTGAVTAIDFSRDSLVFATATKDGYVRLYDVITKQLRRQLSFDAIPTDVALNRNGDLTAVALDNNVIYVFKSDGKLAYRTELMGRVSGLFFDDTAGRLIVGMESDLDIEGQLLALNAATGETVWKDPGWVMQLAVSKDQSLVSAVFFELDGIQVYRAENGEKLSQYDVFPVKDKDAFPGESTNSVAAEFSPDGSLLATVDEERTLRLIDLAKGEVTRTVYQDTGKVRSLLANGKILSFSADGKVIFSQAGPNVRGYDVSTGQETFHVAHRGAIRQIATGPNLNYFATGSADHTVKVVATADGSEIFRLSHTAPVTSVKFSLDGRFLGTGSEDGTALLVDTSKWPRKLVDCQTFNGLVVSRANADILTCQGSNDTKIIRLTTGEQVLSLEPYIAFSINRSSDRIAVQDRSGLRVMSFPGGKELVRIPGKFQRSALSPDGSLLAGSVDETVTIWSVSAGALIFSQKLDYSESLMFLNDKILVVRSQDHGGMVDHFISIASKQEIGFFPYGRLVTETALDNSGRYMAAAAENSIDLLQLNPQIAKTRSCSWFEAVRSLALSPDGTELAVGGAGYIGVFRTEDCRELGRIPQEGNVDGIAFGAGPAILAMESRGDQLEIDSYSLRPPDLLTEACGRLTRNLSATEWRRYFGAARYHKTCSGLPEGSDQLPIPLSKGRTKSTQLEPQP